MSLELSDYEVVSGSLIDINDEPTVNFYNGRIYANRKAIDLLPGVDFVQFLVSRERKTLVFRPRPRGTKDTFKWVGNTEKREPRHIRCLPFYYMVFEMMGWDYTSKYRIYASKEMADGEAVLLMELSEYEKYEADAETKRLSKQPMLPIKFDGHFGNTVAKTDEVRRGNVRVFEDLAVFEMAFETRKKQKTLPRKEAAEEALKTDGTGGEKNGNDG